MICSLIIKSHILHAGFGSGPVHTMESCASLGHDVVLGWNFDSGRDAATEDRLMDKDIERRIGTHSKFLAETFKPSFQF